MKKKGSRSIVIILVPILLILLGILALTLLLPTEDDPPVVDGMENWQKMYERIADAVEIDQTIIISRGKLIQFESGKTITATDNGYSVVGSEKVLNEVNLDTDGAYMNTPVSYQVNSAAEFAPTLTLRAENFETGYTLTSILFDARVRSGKDGVTLGLTEQLPSTTNDMTLSLSSDGERITSISINYIASNQSTVRIVLTFEY